MNWQQHWHLAPASDMVQCVTFWKHTRMADRPYIMLGIESSCDETAAKKKERIVNDFPTFTITGSIGDDVRDYQQVLKALELLVPRLDRKIKLVILGQAKRKSGQRLKAAFDEIDHPKLEIKTFSNYISQKTFDNFLIQILSSFLCSLWSLIEIGICYCQW